VPRGALPGTSVDWVLKHAAVSSCSVSMVGRIRCFFGCASPLCPPPNGFDKLTTLSLPWAEQRFLSVRNALWCNLSGLVGWSKNVCFVLQYDQITHGLGPIIGDVLSCIPSPVAQNRAMSIDCIHVDDLCISAGL
jgi:hypothetical protein